MQRGLAREENGATPCPAADSVGVGVVGGAPDGADACADAREMEVRMFQISGKTAVVTGGTSGIGLACARALLEKGARALWQGATPSAGQRRWRA